MTALSPSITEDAVFTALNTLLATVVDCTVVRLPNNRVPMPKGAFISISPSGNAALSTNLFESMVDTRKVTRPSQYKIQLDCYGPGSGDRATAIAMLLRDQYSRDIMSSSGIIPLYSTDAHQMPLVDGEDQYEERWTFEAVLQINPAVTFAQQTTDTITITNYPPIS